MGLKIFYQIVFGAAILLVGQVSIGGETIGMRFYNQVKSAGLWGYTQLKESRLFSDVKQFKSSVQGSVQKANAIKADLSQRIADTKGLGESIQSQVERARNEVFEPISGVAGDDDDDDDDGVDESEPEENEGVSVGSVDQDTILKNLP